MTWTKRWRTGVSALAIPLVLVTAGCGVLDVSNPTVIEDDQLNNATGAELLRGTALGQFYRAFGVEAVATGLITDEFTVYSLFGMPPGYTELDRRDFTQVTVGVPTYSEWPAVRRGATVALAKLLRYGSREHAGEMLALRGHATLRLAANFCPGFPITELVGFTAIVGTPVTTTQAFERALADFDSAVTYVVDSARILDFARVGRAAALLSLGRFADAAAAAADVPTSYTWQARYVTGAAGQRNPLLFTSSNPEQFHTIVDREGGNGLDFISAQDPRAEPRQYGMAVPPAGAGEPVYNPAKYVDDGSPIVVAGGIEARLIEAEAALATGNGAWLTILNDLRGTQVSPALAALDDPGTPEARLDLLFRERAFWLFATGHRLADLLRLVRLYGRDPESVFPVGPYHQYDQVYGTTTSIPFGTAEASNPLVTGCTGL